MGLDQDTVNTIELITARRDPRPATAAALTEGAPLMSKVLDALKRSAKAVVAVATPSLVVLVNDVTAELSKQSTGLLAALATGIVVWLTPNARPPAQS